MPSPMRISKEGLALLKRFEGFRPRAIALPDGRHLMGYGHTKFARSGAVVTEAQADLLLRHDLLQIVRELNAQIYAPLSQSQFDALAMLSFNIGLDNFRTSGICQHLNAGENLAAVRKMSGWRCAMVSGRAVVIDALVRRRAAEQALFMRTPFDVRPATSGLVRPIQDDAGDLITASRQIDFASAQSLTQYNREPDLSSPAQGTARHNSSVGSEKTVLKPPSTLRARFYDLLRTKHRQPRGREAIALGDGRSSDVALGDHSWMGLIVLFVFALAFAIAAGFGVAGIIADIHAGRTRSAVSAAIAFGCGMGALYCTFAGIRILFGRTSDARAHADESAPE